MVCNDADILLGSVPIACTNERYTFNPSQRRRRRIAAVGSGLKLFWKLQLAITDQLHLRQH
jgi:hypothetical protein